MFVCKRSQEKEHGLVDADPDDHRRPADVLLVKSYT